MEEGMGEFKVHRRRIFNFENVISLSFLAAISCLRHRPTSLPTDLTLGAFVRISGQNIYMQNIILGTNGSQDTLIWSGLNALPFNCSPWGQPTTICFHPFYSQCLFFQTAFPSIIVYQWYSFHLLVLLWIFRIPVFFSSVALVMHIKPEISTYNFISYLPVPTHFLCH